MSLCLCVSVSLYLCVSFSVSVSLLLRSAGSACIGAGVGDDSPGDAQDDSGSWVVSCQCDVRKGSTRVLVMDCSAGQPWENAALRQELGPLRSENKTGRGAVLCRLRTLDQRAHGVDRQPPVLRPPGAARSAEESTLPMPSALRACLHMTRRVWECRFRAPPPVVTLNTSFPRESKQGESGRADEA